MTTTERDEALRVLAALTMLRAGTTGEVEVPVPANCGFPRLEPGHTVTAIRLNGMAEMQSEMLCDQCGKSLPEGEVVLGKGIGTSVPGFTTSFFSPTCLACFSADRGGYYSLAVAFMVMKT